MRPSWASGVLLAMLIFALAGCGDNVDATNPTTVAGALEPTSGFQSWRLPKTVLNISATYTYKSCKIGKDGEPELDLSIDLDPGVTTIADPDPFVDHIGDKVQVSFDALQSFWQDRSLTVTRFMPSGIINKLGAAAEDQTGTIVGNVISAGVRTAAIAFGVPSPGAAPGTTQKRACGGKAANTVAAIESIKAQLKPLDLTSRRAKSLVARSNALQDQIAVKAKVAGPIDPLVTPVLMANQDACGVAVGQTDNVCIAVLVPAIADIRKAGWYDGDIGDGEDLRIAVHLDFAKASPSIIGQCQSGTTCVHHPTRITHDTHFREVAYLPMNAVRGATRTEPGAPLEIKCTAKPCAIPFAQFGIPRALPVKAGLFEKFNWNITFLENGEISDSGFGSSASGVKATGLLNAAAGSAASVATERRNSLGAADSETVRNQAEVARLKSITDVVDYRDKVDALKASGKWPQ